MASIRDVAKEANVSMATVSYVLNKNKYVSDELTRRVWEAVRQLNYTTNRLASSLRNKKTYEIGVVLQNIGNIFFAQLLSGLEGRLQELGYHVVLFDTNYNIDQEKNIIRSIRERWVDGVILYSCVSEEDKSEYAKFLKSDIAEKNIPIVSLDRDFYDKDIPLVTSDNYGGGYMAVKHLMSIQKKKILLMTFENGWDIFKEREKGYLAAMKDFGLQDNIEIVRTNFRPNNAYETCVEMIDNNWKYDGLFAVNDQVAVSCIKAFKERNIRIPEDVAIVGYDNLFIDTLIEPSLTSINVPRYEMGIAVADAIINRMDSREVGHVVLDTHLSVRQTTNGIIKQQWNLKQIMY
jgi:DNA-binding LacI/PurR family transcriptional regulator